MKKKIFKIKVDESDCFMDAISLVDFPAVEVNWLKFSEDITYQKFDKEKHIITGVVCLADTPIYRYNEKYGEYYVVFEKETILKMVEKYSSMGLFNSVNIQHDDTKFVDNVVLLESFIIDYERGINPPKEFKNIPDGSWLCSFKVNNDDLWQDITEGKLKGFSLQGLFRLEEETIDSYFNTNKNLIKELIMNFNIKLRNLLLRFNDMITDKGTITIDGDLKVGANVYVNDEPAPDGEYITEIQIIKVVNGIVEEIIEKETEETVIVEQEETVEPTEDVESLKVRIEELEGLLKDRDAIIEELTAKLKEAEDKLNMSVEKLAKEIKVDNNKTIYSFLNNKKN